MPNKPRYDLNQSPLYKLGNRSKLARLLGLSLRELELLTVGDSLYTEFEIPKKTGGVRHVENPCKSLKLVQAKIARILARITPPDFLYCPVKGRCYVSNAAVHRDGRMVQCLDIQKFYPSTPQRRVFWFFETILKCKRDIAGLLAKIACYEGHLPTGSPLSPIMAYFAYYDLWQKISEFCKNRDHKLTIYVDDITISGSKVPQRDIWEIRKLIHSYGLRYHKQKTFVDQAAEVTGVIIKEGKLVGPFRQHKKLKEARTGLAKAREDDRDALVGTIAGVSGQLKQISNKN